MQVKTDTRFLAVPVCKVRADGDTRLRCWQFWAAGTGETGTADTAVAPGGQILLPTTPTKP